MNLNTTEIHLLKNESLANDSNDNLRFLQTVAPDQYDWRAQGAVTPIKNQKACGSCWAFSTVATVESQYFLKYKKIMDFSEQNLVDCDTKSFGCSGGYISTAFDYARIYGLSLEAKYPYYGIKKNCVFKSTMSAVKVKSYAFAATEDEEKIKNILFTNGPLTIAINANPLQYYVSGILDLSALECDPNLLNHAINLVGYGIVNGAKYWIVRNSWGTTWGEKGYFRLAMGKGVCGVNKVVLSATIN